MSAPAYEDSVFINCPFDPQYAELFPALVFTVIDCGFVARSAQEEDDSGESRIEKLYRIIASCKYGIHDLSRTELSEFGLPRFNMPLELGIYLGARKFGDAINRTKTCLILDRSQDRYRRFISDLAGNDPKAHRNSPRRAVIVVRNWLRNARPQEQLPGGEDIWKRYRAFRRDLPLLTASFKLNRNALEFLDLTTMINEWLPLNPPRR